MLLLITSIAWLLLFNLIPFEARTAVKKNAKKTTAGKKNLPKQRYKEI
jgi:predicted secreted protein